MILHYFSLFNQLTLLEFLQVRFWFPKEVFPEKTPGDCPTYSVTAVRWKNYGTAKYNYHFTSNVQTCNLTL